MIERNYAHPHRFSCITDHTSGFDPEVRVIPLWDDYAKLESLVGDEVLELTHLKEIWIINFAMPAVLSPDSESDWCKEQLASHPTDQCRAEFARHFVGTMYRPDPFATDKLHHGFSGAVTYWIGFGACEASGGSAVCSPIASVIEDGFELMLAPSISDTIYDRANPS